MEFAEGCPGGFIDLFLLVQYVSFASTIGLFCYYNKSLLLAAPVASSGRSATCARRPCTGGGARRGGA